MPGFTSYSTTTSVADALAYYQEQAALGGEMTSAPAVSEIGAMFGYTQGSHPLLVIIGTFEGDTTVSIIGLADTEGLAVAEEVPDLRDTMPAAAPTECAAGDGGVPMLPDATAVQSMPNIVNYSSATSVTDVVKFYTDHFTALGAQVSSPMPASAAMAMLEVRQGSAVFTISIMSMGGTSNVTVTSASMGALSPSGGC